MKRLILWIIVVGWMIFLVPQVAAIYLEIQNERNPRVFDHTFPRLTPAEFNQLLSQYEAQPVIRLASVRDSFSYAFIFWTYLALSVVCVEYYFLWPSMGSPARGSTITPKFGKVKRFLARPIVTFPVAFATALGSTYWLVGSDMYLQYFLLNGLILGFYFIAIFYGIRTIWSLVMKRLRVDLPHSGD